MYGCVFHKEDGFCEKFSDDRCKSYCVMGPCQYAIPSNADRIQTMSVEELAVFCEDGCPPGAPICNSVETIEGETVKEHCQRCWLNWLKARVRRCRMAEYIERKAFVAQKRKQYCMDCNRRKGMKNGKLRFCYDIGEAPCRACETNDMLDDVEDFPAADVAPVRHGRWGKNNDCSECGCQPWFERDIHTLNYCPNCGAKMDGGKT